MNTPIQSMGEIRPNSDQTTPKAATGNDSVRFDRADGDTVVLDGKIPLPPMKRYATSGRR